MVARELHRRVSTEMEGETKGSSSFVFQTVPHVGLGNPLMAAHLGALIMVSFAVKLCDANVADLG